MYKKISLERLIIYDIETSVNAIIVCCLDYATKKKKEFIFYNSPEYYDQPLEFYKFLRSCIRGGYTFFGFNVLNFDSQVLHKFYTECQNHEDPLYEYEIQDIINELYNKAQELINTQGDFRVLVPEYKLFAPHIDVFRQLHYDRPAKATSLKWVEFSMRHHLIKEMPYDHDYVLNKDELVETVEYCWDDVDATHNFFEKVKFETETRLDLSKEFDLNLINASEPRMVRDIFGKFLCEEMGVSGKELRELKTYRNKIAFKDIIFPYISFQTPMFKNVLKVFEDTVLDASPYSKETFKHSFPLQDMVVDLGLGGIHACVPPGIYKHNEDEVFEDADGTSYYPFLAIKNNLRPAHLGEAFNKVYPMMYERRTQYSKKDPRNYIYKIVLNSCYGLSKEINGYLYDPQMTYSITINGQLSLLMLVEALHISVPHIKFIQFNTDGITYIYKKNYEDTVRKICKWWEQTTKINLEYVYYQQMIIRDVNNYIGHYSNGDLKKKGIFETEMPFHKNPSSLIIPKALEAYFIHNTPIEDFIKNPDNSIFDFCNGVKKKSNFKINLIQNFNYAELIKEQQKVCRFIVAKPNDYSGLLVKDFDDGRRVSIVADGHAQPLDRIVNDKVTNYKVDYDWYIKSAKKIKELVEPSVQQATLF